MSNAEIRALETKLQSAQDEVKRLQDLIANPRLVSMNVGSNSLDLEVEGVGPVLFAQSFSDYFKKSGATNFVEVRMISPDPEIGELICTLQRAQGETPTQQRNFAQAALAQMIPIVKFAGMVLGMHRNDGYPGDVDGAAIQDAAVGSGLLEKRLMSERCGEQCSCAEVVGADEWLTDGVVCYFTTDAGRIALEAAK